VSALGDEDVGGLDVAMDNAFAVRGVERVGNFDRQTEQDIHLQRTAGDAMLEGQAIEILHGDEGAWHSLHQCRRWCRCWDG
jgi:hypothetical protein